MSSGTVDPAPLARSASPTPAASSVGASSPALPTNIGIADWFGPKAAASQTGVVPQPPKTSVSTSAIAGGSTRGSSKPSCRPWERGDLLCRLGTFKPSNWSGKPKEASSLSCARRGWVNVDIDKIECEACSAHLTFPAITSLMPKDVDNEVEAFVENLDSGHKVACPWRGNCCADSLVQFPPTPPSALIGGYKDRCDGLLQFECLPVIASSAIETIKLSRATQIDRFLSLPHSLSCGDLSFKADDMPLTELSRDDVFTRYSNAQKLISLCGWEPRWLANLQDCEEHSAQSTKNAYSFFPSEDRDNSSHFLESNKKDKGKRIMDSAQESRPISKSPLLDCSLCGTTVRVLDFLLLPRPARFCNTPDTAKKTILTRGTSAASGIGWVADGIEKENIDEVNEGKSLPNAGVDLNLTMAGGLPSTNFAMPVMSENLVGDNCIGRDLIIGQPSASAIGDRAASYESRGLSTNRKRNLEEGGSTVDRPQDIVQRADSIEGTVIDRDTDEIDDGTQDDSEGPAKRSRRLDLFETHHSSLRVDSSGAGPSRNFSLDIDIDVNRTIGHPYARDSTRASSVVAMDTIGNGADEDSMESVENYPGDFDDVHLPSPSLNRNLDTEPNYSNQAQQSTCAQPLAAREMESSSTNEGEELLNAETVNANARDRLSIGVSGGSVGMGASHEAEIHGADVYLHRADSIVGDAEPIIAEVVENAGQMGESAPGPGLMDESVPGDMGAQQGDSQDVMSQLVGKADSGSKIYGSTKEDSDESGKKTSFNVGLDSNVHPSLSCNAMISYGRDMSKEEVTQNGNSVMDYDFVLENGLANGENDFVAEPREFDPIKYHNTYCPWVNGNVAAAGCDSSGDSNSGSSLAICGWQLTLDALDNPQSLGIGPNQYMQSESAASQYKDDHLNPHPNLLKRHASSKSQGYR